MPHHFIKDLKVGDKVVDFYLVKSKRNKVSRAGKTFLDLDLSDRSGQINAKVWERAEPLSESFSRGDVIKVRAVVEEYQGARQLVITDLRPVAEGDPYSLDDLIKSCPYDCEGLMNELLAEIDKVRDERIKELLLAFFQDEEFKRAFMAAPASRNLHHPYRGGLLEHSLKVLRVALVAADELYPGEVDRDLLVAGAILHDVGKMEELDPDLQGGYTTVGYLLGHITLGAHMVRERARALHDFPQDLLQELEHILLSHHGEREWGAPVVPMTPEALIIHFCDNLDAKTQIALSALEDDPHQEEAFTEWHKTMGRHFFKSPRRKKNAVRVVKDEQ
jgi:3'-5' exoribonuclease